MSFAHAAHLYQTSQGRYVHDVISRISKQKKIPQEKLMRPSTHMERYARDAVINELSHTGVSWTDIGQIFMLDREAVINIVKAKRTPDYAYATTNYSNLI